jgi:hypothetical protein
MRVTLKGLLAPALLVGALFAPLSAQAQEAVRHPRSINARERRQERRIRQGERSGELTRREARHLERREVRVNRAEWRARRSGGTLTAQERWRLNRRLNRDSRAIYRQKHDRQENERRENRHERR